jgi:hypothetical protein
MVKERKRKRKDPSAVKSSKTLFVPEKTKPAHLFILVLLTLLCLGLFAGKAFHIDDPLFLWTARQIQSHPADFYGFSVNWAGGAQPMSEVTKNPPLASYYIALIASISGWSELALHLAFLLPALAAILGTYFLARRFCNHPLLAAAIALTTPVFLVSSTSVMCDTMMLALWIWAVLLWMRGLESENVSLLIFASLLIAACALTKYYGMSLIPLLLIYSLIQTRRIGRWALCLLIPVIILGGYQGLTHLLYGRGLLLDAASFASGARSHLGATVLSKGLVGLVFTGGCIAPVLFYAPLLWRGKTCVIGVILFFLLALIVSAGDRLGEYPLRDGEEIRWALVFQIGLWASAGIGVLALAISDLQRGRNAQSLLLFLWVAGTFIFASFVNWTINGRSILPMAPALGILLARRIEQRFGSREAEPLRIRWPLIPAVLLALFVSWADYRLAGTARSVAAEIHEKYGSDPGRLWFQGHWGFQYYMEARGARAFDRQASRPTPGDFMVVPKNNTGTMEMKQDKVQKLENIRRFPGGWLTTMHFLAGAGYYADIWGPLPFALGPAPPEEYDIYLLGP